MSLLEFLLGVTPISRREFLTLKQEVQTLMATQAEMTAKVQAVQEKLVKIGTETTTLKEKVDELTALVEGAGDAVSDELASAVEALAQQAQIVDDLVQDAENPEG